MGLHARERRLKHDERVLLSRVDRQFAPTSRRQPVEIEDMRHRHAPHPEAESGRPRKLLAPL
jgi:hypothetical protein